MFPFVTEIISCTCNTYIHLLDLKKKVFLDRYKIRHFIKFLKVLNGSKQVYLHDLHLNTIGLYTSYLTKVTCWLVVLITFIRNYILTKKTRLCIWLHTAMHFLIPKRISMTMTICQLDVLFLLLIHN